MLDIKMHSQVDDESCGPTSLYSVYQYWGDDITLDEVMRTVKRVKNGGTLASLLGLHALERGYRVELYVFNLNIFDPSWFRKGVGLQDKLKQQLQVKKGFEPFKEASQAYIDFLQAGGLIRHSDLTAPLLQSIFKRKIPILTGLSATYLYDSKREKFVNGVSILDDIEGEPCGHFVVLGGYDDRKKRIVVADPHRENPLSHDNYYKVGVGRLIHSILLGVLTYDANLLLISR